MKTILLIILSAYFQSSLSATFEDAIVKAALARTKANVRYDGAYFSINYPNGDVPSNLGVCTDVVIRTYRTLGIDLQLLVHEDISANFSRYPSKRIWGLTKPDTNIDHRRVPNLQVFFARHGKTLRVSSNKADYHKGEIVTWLLPGNLPHIGIVSDSTNSITGNPMIIHNIGEGAVLQDMLFDYKITGHYQYFSKKQRH